MTANTSSSTCYDKIFNNLDQKKIWTSDLLFNLNDKLETDPEFVNLSEILKSRNNFAFPSHFNGVENKSKLIIALRLSAMKCGFWLVLRTSKSQKQLNKHHLAYLTLSCQHGVTFHRSRSVTNKRNCQTRYSINADDCCPFRMNISLCKETNIWFLHCRKGSQKEQADLHKNHLPMQPEHLHSHISLFPESQQQLLNECSQIHINNTRIASLINLRNVLGIDNKWTRYQIRYLQDKNNVLSGLTPSSTSAEMLIEALSSRDESNYLYVTFEPTEGLTLMTGKVPLMMYLKSNLININFITMIILFLTFFIR